MAGETTPPAGATRFIETTRGVLGFTQLAPLLAERVLGVERAIATGAFSAHPPTGELILQFHLQIAGISCRTGRGAGVTPKFVSVFITRHRLIVSPC